MTGALASVAEAAWTYGGPEKSLSAQLLSPHWKLCVAVERQWRQGRVEAASVRLLGPVLKPRWQAPSQGTEIIAVRLHPEAAAGLVDCVPGDIADEDVDIGTVEGVASVRRLAEQAASAEAVTAELLKLCARHAATAHTTPRVAAAARLIRASGGRRSVRLIADELGTSERTLHRGFVAEVALAPKKYARLVRLQRLLLRADELSRPDWADLAYAHGFSDQAHMSSEVKALTGERLTRLHSLRRFGLATP